MGNIQQESGFNPGIWQALNDLIQDYGLVQWTPATNFLDWAVNAGLLKVASANAANEWTQTDSLLLMKAELNCLIWNCSTDKVFYPPTPGKDPVNTDKRMTFAEYKASTLDAGLLAKVFHDHYERSNDGIQEMNKRAENAQKWFDRL